MRPVIGVAAGDSLRQRSAEGVPDRPHAALKQDYLDAIERAGGDPLIIPVDGAAPAARIFGRLDGVMLTGGADVDPVRYGERARFPNVSTNVDRDGAEFRVLQAATEARLPVLAICRGLQVLNVARGGTLYQDLPAQRPDALAHQQEGQPNAAGHDVAIVAGSRLQAVVASLELRTNSFHHQAIRDVGRGLRITARTSDGLVEAVEDPAQPFLLGVQWHPEEMLNDPPHLAIFEALVRASATD